MDDRDPGGARPGTLPQQPRRTAGPVTAPRHSTVPAGSSPAVRRWRRHSSARSEPATARARAATGRLLPLARAATGRSARRAVTGGFVPLARAGLPNLVGAGFAATAGLGVTWLVARTLGPASAGGFFAAVAAFTLATGAARLGTTTGLVYWVARYRARGRPDLAGACLRVGLGPVTAAAAGLALALWIVAPWLGPFVLLLPAAALSDAMLAATRGYRLMRPTVALDKLLRPALQLTGVAALAVIALWTAVPPAAWPLVWALPYLPVALLAGYALRAVAGRESPAPTVPSRSAATPFGLAMHPDHRIPAGAAVRGPFWRFTGPRAVASVLQLALQRLDILLVAALAGPAAAAVYTVAGRFVVLGQLVNQATGYPVQPRLAEHLGTGDLAGAERLYRTVTAWLLLTTWPLYLLVIGYAPLYLGIFGDAYRDAAPVVVVLAAAMLLATACGPVDMVLAMAGRTRWNLLNVVVALAAMVAVDLALIPRLGAIGAAAGLAVAVAANNLLPLAQIWYALRLHPFGRTTLAVMVLTTVVFGLLPAALRAVI